MLHKDSGVRPVFLHTSAVWMGSLLLELMAVLPLGDKHIGLTRGLHEIMSHTVVSQVTKDFANFP